MPPTLVEPLRPLTAMIGRWRSSGSVVDEHGNVTMHVTGSDTYAVLPGGRWIAHDVDVHMGDDHTLVHEVIGGVHPDGGWQMHAFGEDGAPEVMRLSQHEPAVLVLHGDGVRSRFRIDAGEGSMTTRWEREVDGRWLPWIEMRFERDRATGERHAGDVSS